MIHDAKEGVLLCLHIEPWPPSEEGILRWTAPGRRQPWTQRRQREGGLMRLVDVIDAVARMRREPRRHEVRPLFDRGNFPCRKGLHNHAPFLIRYVRVLVPHRHRTGELAIGK